MKKWFGQNNMNKGVQGGTFLRLMLGIIIFASLSGFALPILLEILTEMDKRKAQNHAEYIVEAAARWYLINNGNPIEVMDTEAVKQALIPHYLNRWPGKETIKCEINTDGTITVWTIQRE
jgi:type II secretory pathway pseudopilin PulG